MRSFILPILNDARATFRSWADELRGKNFLTDEDVTPTAYSPLIMPSGSMTITATDIRLAEYFVIGDRVELEVSCILTLSGVASNLIRIQLPRVASEEAVYAKTPFAVAIYDAAETAGVARIGDENYIYIYKTGGGNYALAADKRFSVYGCYRISQ